MVNPGGNGQQQPPPSMSAGSLPWKRCAGCGGKIADRFLLYAMDGYWHSRCLKCSCCQAQLGEIGTSCYTKSGMILCRNDYIRLFGNSGACSACGQSIPASELVMRAQGNVYHLKKNHEGAAMLRAQTEFSSAGPLTGLVTKGSDVSVPMMSSINSPASWGCSGSQNRCVKVTRLVGNPS
uniref:LIM domain only 4b n=1 Tax=Hippocampus comes TaxID=109280 RepID=A0A3Q2XQC7_HIPCM